MTDLGYEPRILRLISRHTTYYTTSTKCWYKLEKCDRLLLTPDSHQTNVCWHNQSCAISWEASNVRIVMTNNLQHSFAIYILSFGLIYCIGDCFASVSYVLTLLTITALQTGLRPRFSHYLCVLCVLIFYPWCAESNMEFVQNNFRPYFYFYFWNVRSEILFQEISSFHYFLL